MNSSFFSFRSWIENMKLRKKIRKPSLSYQPSVEQLESRELLAILVWNPGQNPANFDWSNANNWQDATGRQQAPRVATNGQTPDTLLFGGAGDVPNFAGFNGNVASSFDDIPGLTVASISIGANYTGTISLSQSLTAQNGSILNGTINGQNPRTLNLDSTTTPAFQLGNCTLQNITLSDSPTSTVQINAQAGNSLRFVGCQFDNWGTVNLLSGGILENSSTFTNYNTMNLSANTNITSIAGTVAYLPNSTFVNQEAATLSFAGSSTISADFVNYDGGTVNLSPGFQVRLLGGATGDGSYFLGMNSTLMLTVADQQGATGSWNVNYSGFSNIFGTGTFKLQGTKSNTGYSGLPMLNLGSGNISLPATITFQSIGAYISGAGTLSLAANNNIIQNTWIISGATVNIESALTISQNATYGNSQNDASQILSGSTLNLSPGATLTVSNVNVYMGNQAQIVLNCFPVPSPPPAGSTLNFVGNTGLLPIANQSPIGLVMYSSTLTNNGGTSIINVKPTFGANQWFQQDRRAWHY